MKTKLLSLLLGMSFLYSCASVNKTMREPNTRVNLELKDFTLSEQVIGEAKVVRVFGIDFSRILSKKTGATEKDGSVAAVLPSLSSIPVVGGLVATDPTASYALYDMMEKNKGYDVVFYPQYETTIERPIGFGFLYKITTVKAAARLGKLK